MDTLKKCSRCKKELPKTVDYFHRWKHSKDGFRSACKKCRGGDYGVIQPNKVYKTKDGYQYCSRCRKLLPLSNEYFRPDKRLKSGYGSRCKVCEGISDYGIHYVYIQKNAQDGFKYCTKCLRELPATTDYFYSDKRSGAGFNSHCKECKGQSFGETKFNPHVTDAVKEGYYICRCCKKELPLTSDYFTKQVSRSTGYSCYCKECSRRKERNIINKKIEKYRTMATIKERRRRSLKRNLPSTLTSEQWEDCLAYFDYKDAYTGLPMEIASQDHVIPISHGGEYTVNNIIPCEKSINSSKGNKDFFDWYPKQSFYSKKREAKILDYLGYHQGVQQLSLA